MSGKRFKHVIPVRFGDADLAGILYFPRIFHFCHVCMEEFVEATLGRTYREFTTEGDRGFPTVHTEADYHRPMPFGEKLRLEMSVSKMGTSSLGFRWRVYPEGTTEPCAEVRSTVVCVSMKEFKKRALPEDVRAAFTPYLEA